MRGRGVEKAKACPWLSPETIEELQREARRLERPISWIMQRAWLIARPKLFAVPTPDGNEDAGAQ